MKKSMIQFVTGAVLGVTLLQADVIELKDGTRIDGRILAENEDSLEIEVRKNETGTIRYVMIIHSSEVSSWVADQEGRISREKGVEVNRLAGTDYVKQLINEANQEIDRGNYDKGIEEFGIAADLATQKLDRLDGQEKVDALKVRAYALKLQLAALEGKEESIEKKTDGVQEEMEEREKELKKDFEDFEQDKEDYQEDFKKNKVQLGERHVKSDLVKREEELEQRRIQFIQTAARVERALAEYAEELIQTRTRIKLAEERVEQAEDDAKDAEKSLRRR